MRSGPTKKPLPTEWLQRSDTVEGSERWASSRDVSGSAWTATGLRAAAPGDAGAGG